MGKGPPGIGLADWLELNFGPALGWADWMVEARLLNDSLADHLRRR